MVGPAESDSKSAIIKAIAGNAVVTATKAAAWVASGSGALFAETIHSLVDTLNQVLLLIGHQRSLREPTSRHPYGFGIEAHFWGLLAAIGILLLGGGLSIAHSVESLAHPELPDHLPAAFAVLIVSVLIEMYVLVSVLRQVAKSRGGQTWRQHLAAQRPGTITVLLEDAAAVLGCVVAAVAIGICHVTQSGLADAVAQLVIGTLLAVVGLYLVWRNRGALIGQSLPPEHVADIRVFLEDLPAIDRVTELKTRQLGHGLFKLKAEVVFSGGELARGLMGEFVPRLRASASDAETAELLGRYAERLMQFQAAHVDELEGVIAARFPGAAYIDLEPHERDL